MQAAKLRIVEANLLLVASIVKQYHVPTSPISFLDLMQEESIGLMKAAQNSISKGDTVSVHMQHGGFVRQSIEP